MDCLPSLKLKYASRPSPPIPANECEVNTVKKGHDGHLWQVRQVGKSYRWVRCKHGECDNLQENKLLGVSGDGAVILNKNSPPPTKKTPKPTFTPVPKASPSPKKTKMKKPCNPNQERNPKTKRCVKKCSPGSTRNPKTGRCKKDKV